MRMLKPVIAGLTAGTIFAFAQVDVRRSDSVTEAGAIGALRAVSSAQQMYAAAHGGYAQSLTILAAPCRGASEGFVSRDLERDPAIIGGYQVRLHADAHADGRLDCNGKPTAAAYYATAVPVQHQRQATRAFAVDQNAVIWYDLTGAAPKPPFHETATISQLR
jgi:hypothetical protein